MPTYKQIRYINKAAEEAYKEGSLNKNQFLKLLDDLENEIIVLEGKKIDNDFKELILAYSTV